MFRSSNLVSINFNNNFDTSNVTNMRSMFYYCSKLTSLDLSCFNTSNVTDMSDMFNYCLLLTNLDMSNFDVSNVTTMYSMFYYCKALKNLDLSSFKTSKVTTTNYMFFNCASLTTINLSNFDTSSVESMNGMFNRCYVLANLDISNFNTSNVTNMQNMFRDSPYVTTTISITNPNLTIYGNIFSNVATSSNAKIIVNYTSATSTLVDNMIATKSSDGNVVKGNIIPEYSISLSGDNDIQCEFNSGSKGSKVTLTSISGKYWVVPFKMNGTTIQSNAFTMPDSNVTITDIVTVKPKIIETAHNPYPNSQDNVVVGEYTFEGAKSLTVILDYQTASISYDWFYIYDSSTATRGINDNRKYGGYTRMNETITINSNYIKITFISDSSGNYYYGLKAIIIPNY